ncbi:hypothetical protein RJ639_017453, partial [Escallonia herrerae]
MSHFGRTGPPDIADTYSLLILNITFRTTADDLFPLFDKYGKVVDIFIPRDKKTGDSRGFAFVRYKYADEAQKAVDRLDGRVVDGREIAVQFAKYGPNAERIHKGRIIEKFPDTTSSRSPRGRYRDDYYRDRDYRRRSRSRSWDRYERGRYHGRDRDYHYRSRSRSASPDYYRGLPEGAYPLVSHPLLPRVKVLVVAAQMNGLQFLEVFHLENVLIILGVLLQLNIQM